MKTASYWHKHGQNRIRCDLCPQECEIAEGAVGRCRVRGVRDGVLVALGYGRVASLHDDPVEKKPLYHYYPGRTICSVGGWGCNLACRFCQNWSISQQGPPASGRCYAAETIVDAAAGSLGLAYTYNEPLVGYEFVYDMARLAHARGLKNVLVTNGHINARPAEQLLPFIDALNIDVKSIDADFYREQCGGKLEAVLHFAVQARAAGCHVELTNLVIPSLNDKADHFRRLASWVADTLGADVPLHLSAYRPCFKMDLPATSGRVLEQGWDICSGLLDYVYLGNVLLDKGSDTYCPGCRARLVQRSGFRAQATGIADGRCMSCGRPADVVSS